MWLDDYGETMPYSNVYIRTMFIYTNLTKHIPLCLDDVLNL